MIYIGWSLAILAILILLVAAFGVIRLPDALSRQHAVTKAAPVGVNLFAIAMILVSWASGWGWEWSLKLLLIIVIVLITLPVAGHALARSGLAESDKSTLK